MWEKLGHRGAAARSFQVSAGRASRWGGWPSLLPVWGDGSFLHQHPGTAGKGCFPSRESQAECQLIRNSFAASWSPERAGVGVACWQRWAGKSV